MRLSANDEAIGALERIGTRRGYRPLRLALGVTRPVLAYPEFDEFTDLALTVLLEGAAEVSIGDGDARDLGVGHRGGGQVLLQPAEFPA